MSFFEIFSIGTLEHTHRHLRQPTTLADHGLRLAALHTFRVYLGAPAAHTLDPLVDDLSIRHSSTARDDLGIIPMSPRVLYSAHCISMRPGRLSSTGVSRLQHFSATAFFMDPQTALRISHYYHICFAIPTASTFIIESSNRIRCDYSGGMLDKHPSFRTYRVST